MLYAIRHYSTEWNERKILQGKTDIPLSTNGINDLKDNLHVYQSYNFELIVSSELKRSKQTAEIIAKHTHCYVKTSQSLNELDHGKWEQQKMDALFNKGDYRLWLEDPFLISVPCSKEDIFDRLLDFSSLLKDLSAMSVNKNILLVCHLHIFALWLSSIKGKAINISKYRSLKKQPFNISNIIN